MLSPPQPDRAARGRDAGALFLLALGVNLILLGAKSIAHDEAGSVLYARMPLGALAKVLSGGDPNMSLYYVILNAWVGLFGESEAAVRFPSVLFGALTVPAIYLLGCRLFGRRAGLIAGLLLALNAFMVQYAQIARSYALLVLLVTLSSLCFARELERPSAGNRIGYVSASALAVYAHYFAVYVLAAQWMTLAAVLLSTALASEEAAQKRGPPYWRASLPRRRGGGSAEGTRQWMGAIASILLLCAPAVLIASRGQGSQRIDWIQPPALKDIGGVLLDFTGHSWVLLGALSAAGCYATARGAREHRLWPPAFAATWWLLPIALSFTVSFVKPMFLSNYLIICLPALILFGAAGVARLRPAAVSCAVVALLVWVSATRLAAYYDRAGPQNWREAARHVLSSIRPDDGFVFFPDSARTPFGYYVRQSGMTEPTDLAGRSLAGRQRVWFVIRASDLATMRPRFLRLQSGLQENFRLAERRAFGAAEIELYVR